MKITKRDFIKGFKELQQGVEQGYFGTVEMIDELWIYVYQEQQKIKELEKKLKKLEKS